MPGGILLFLSFCCEIIEAHYWTSKIARAHGGSGGKASHTQVQCEFRKLRSFEVRQFWVWILPWSVTLGITSSVTLGKYLFPLQRGRDVERVQWADVCILSVHPGMSSHWMSLFFPLPLLHCLVDVTITMKTPWAPEAMALRPSCLPL